MTDLAAAARITSLLSVLLLCACAQNAPLVRPADPLAAQASARATEATTWWDIKFGLRWDAEQAADWHLDAALAEQICSPALTQFESRLTLWRFHRRAVADAAGHQFRLSVFTDPDTAAALYARIQENPLLAWMRAQGHVTRLDMVRAYQAPQPALAQTSDPAWAPEIQSSWPYFIMGVSQAWLKLIAAVRAQQPWPESADWTSVLAHYRSVNERVNTLWREQGQHAYLHHLNALFGYQPLLIRETTLKRF